LILDFKISVKCLSGFPWPFSARPAPLREKIRFLEPSNSDLERTKDGITRIVDRLSEPPGTPPHSK
jgi:hypothetical protein